MTKKDGKLLMKERPMVWVAGGNYPFVRLLGDYIVIEDEPNHLDMWHISEVYLTKEEMLEDQSP